MINTNLKYLPKYLFVFVLVLLVTASLSSGHSSVDEYCQIIEFASYKLGLTQQSELTWEFYSRIRPAFQPSIIVLIYKSLHSIGVSNPFFIAFCSRLLSAILSFVSIYVFVISFLPTIKNAKLQRWFVLLSFFTWISVFNAVRFSSENYSGQFFLLGFSLLFLLSFNEKWQVYFAVGLLFGLGFICRYQVGFLIFGYVLWLIIVKKIKFKYIFWLAFGLITIIAIGVLLDYWLYGELVFAPWNYFWQNIVLGKASTFGEDGWWYYLLVIAFIPFGLFYLLSVFYMFRYEYTNPVSWTIFPFLLSHILISHKEIRFLIPIIGFMPLTMVYFLNTFSNVNYKLTKYIWYINCLLLLVIMLIPAAIQLPLCQKIYNNYKGVVTFYRITEGGNLLNFYKQPNTSIKNIKNISEVACAVKNGVCLLALTCYEDIKYKPLPKYKYKLVYSNCPSWIFSVDFNNWLERTALYKVYELEKVN